MMGAAAVLALCALLQAAPEDRAEALCRGLESADVTTIYHAMGDLVALGEPALAGLESRAAGARGRLRDYLELAAAEIRTARCLACNPPARRISLKASDRNVIELLGELRARTGVVLSLENLMGEERLPEVPVEIRDATMFEAFDAICRAGNVTISMENGQFKLYPDGYVDVPRFFYDHYFFRLESFVLSKSVDFRKPALETFRIQMDMLWNPAAAPCHWGAPSVVEARDDQGKNLVPPPAPPGSKSGEAVDPPDEGVTPSMSYLTLLAPSPGSRKLDILRGTTPIALPRTLTTLSFTAEGGPAGAPGSPEPPGGEGARASRKPGKTPVPRSLIPPAAEPPGAILAEGEVASPSLEGQSRSREHFTVLLARIETASEPAQNRITCEISSSTLKPEAVSRLPILVNVVLKGGEPTRSYVLPTTGRDGVAEFQIYYLPLRLKESALEGHPPAAPLERIDISIVTAVQERRLPFEFRDVKLR